MSLPLVRLGDVAKLQAGVGFPPRLQGRTAGDLPFAKVGDISAAARLGGGPLITARNYVSREDLVTLRARAIPIGSTLFAKIGEAISQNFRVIAGAELLIDNNAMAAIPLAHVDPRFLFRFLQTVNMYKLASTTSVPSLRKCELERIEVPLPSLPEQRRIATILDQADELRAKRRSAIAFLDGLMDALFTSMFCDARARVASSWSVKLSDVARIKSGSTPDRKRPDYFGGGIPWVKTTEVHGDRILSTGESVSDAGQKSARLQQFPANSIVIAMYGQGKTRGQSAVLGIDATVNQACAVILPSEKFHVDFMAQQLRLSYERLRAKAQGGNQANLNLQLVGDLDVLVPPIAEQNLFAGNAKLLRELRNHNSLALSKLDELFASLQHRAFAGQL